MARLALAFVLGIAVTVGSLFAWSHFAGVASGQSTGAVWQMRQFPPTDGEGTIWRNPADLALTPDPNRYINDFLATLPASCAVDVSPAAFVAPWYVSWACP